ERDFETSDDAVTCCDRRREDFYTDLIVPGSRFLHLFELKNFWWSIVCADYGFHSGLLSPSRLLLDALDHPAPRLPLEIAFCQILSSLSIKARTSGTILPNP